jgi:PST family polysaccharide transporter
MRISDGYLMLVTMSLSTYYLPKLSSLLSNGELRTEIFQGYKIILPAVLVSCLPIYFCYFIIGLLYTKDFKQLFFSVAKDFKIAAWLIAFLMTAKDDKFIATEIIFTITCMLH